MTSTFESEKEFHRKIARQCFNEAWNLFDKKSRDDSEGRLMLHLAHASRYHSGIVGTASNIAVSDWQISRIYVSLDQPALRFNSPDHAWKSVR